MSPKRNKTNILISSSDDEDCRHKNTNENIQRSSTRLKTKSEQKRFVMPSRKKLWDTIPSEPLSEKVSLISPKRTVNNFTKVYNSYNYDDYEDTSDDESEDFITDSSGNDISSDEKNTRSKSGRIKNFKRRIKSCSSSSSDDDADTKKKMKLHDDHKSANDNIRVKESGDCGEKIEACLNDFVDDQTNICEGQSRSDSDEGVSFVKKRRNTSVLELESDSDCSKSGESQSISELLSSNENKTSDFNQSDHPTTAANTNTNNIQTDANCAESESSSNSHGPSEKNDVVILSSEEGGSHSSEYSTSDSDSSDSQLKDRSGKFRRKKEKLFQKFKHIQNLRKNSKQCQTSST